MTDKRGWVINENGEVTGFYVEIINRVCKDYEGKNKDHVLIKYWKGDGELMGEDPIYEIVPIERVYFRNFNKEGGEYA